MSARKAAMGTGLVAMVAGAIGSGIYLRHYFVVFVFSIWLIMEFLLWRFPLLVLQGSRLSKRIRFHKLISLLHLYGRFDTVSERLLDQRIREFRSGATLSEDEERWLSRLKDLLELRGIVFGKELPGKMGLRRAFAYASQQRVVTSEDAGVEDFNEKTLSLQDLAESATLTADLYWRLFDTCTSDLPELPHQAKLLYQRIFGIPFEEKGARTIIEGLMDSMQRDFGAPFLLLNLIRNGNWQKARRIAQLLLTSELELDPDIRSSLYWISEINWFVNENTVKIQDYESTIRHLYHLCFTNPDRGGFLEIDSQFFSEFEVVSELAREGFLFKETLVEKLLSLWKEHEGYFDPVFQNVLEALTLRKNKIYDERESWEVFWKRESEEFCREYLFVVEGNICYANRQFDEARMYYERALKLCPRLRPALLNLVFCYAKLGDSRRHASLINELLLDPSFLPSSLYVAADSFLLMGNKAEANRYYEELKSQRGWERRIDYYRSTFCYQNGFYEDALLYARAAYEQNPSDTSVSYQLSLCYNAVGEKDKALTMVKGLGEAPQWLNYYRFTLERDSGRLQEASQTLLRIPTEYFEDTQELEEALEFARNREDLALLRHLRRRE